MSSNHAGIGPVFYVVIFAALLGLTGLTVFLADVEMGHFHVPVALTIATAKTTLVVLFFMHAWYSGRMVYLILATGVLFLAIMMGLTFADYMTRGQNWLPERADPHLTAPATHSSH
jgi:cytochrome c oxidase subunit IV